MRITLLCSCGLLIEEGHHKLAVDLPCADLPPFAPLTPQDKAHFLNALPPFDALSGIVFTHRHPDHYDHRLLRQYRELHPQTPVFVPGQQSPELLTLDWGFSVTAHRTLHVPVDGFGKSYQYAYLVRMGEKSVYITGDALAESAPHLDFLGTCIPDASFYNGQFFNSEPCRCLLREHSGKSFIYHIPPDAEDVSGMRRKCRKTAERYASELGNVTLLEQYPSVIEL